MRQSVAAFVRHGDYRQLPGTPSAHQPFGLTLEGRDQVKNGARELLDTVARHGWRIVPVIDSSRMLRAWQTAEIYASACAAETIESFDALAERGLGCAANLSVTQIEDILREDPRFDAPPPNWKADSDYRLPLQGAESLLEAGRRVAGHVEERMAELVDAGDGGTVKLFIGHGAAFRHAAFHLGVLELERIARISMYHGRAVYLARDMDGRWNHLDGEWKERPANRNAMD